METKWQPVRVVFTLGEGLRCALPFEGNGNHNREVYPLVSAEELNTWNVSAWRISRQVDEVRLTETEDGYESEVKNESETTPNFHSRRLGVKMRREMETYGKARRKVA